MLQAEKNKLVDPILKTLLNRTTKHIKSWKFGSLEKQFRHNVWHIQRHKWQQGIRRLINPNKNSKGYVARKELAFTRRWPSAGRDVIQSSLFLGAKWAFWHYYIKQYSSCD